MESSRTVTDAKTVFLRQQIRLLSTNLQSSSQWRDLAPNDGPEISDKIVDEIMVKVNAKVKQHNRLVYSTESTRHVAEQIDVLYWDAVSKAGSTPEIGPSGLMVNKDVDLSTDETILSLPDDLTDLYPALENDEPHSISSSDFEAYSQLHSHLTKLLQRRSAAQARSTQLRALRRLLKPYENSSTHIQPNLVTRNGDLGKEMDRMRVLLARVTSAIEKDPERNGAAGLSRPINAPTIVGVSDKEKLDAVMDVL